MDIFFVHIFLGKRWKYPKRGFQENARTMGKLGAFYLGYKYYFRPHLFSTKGADLEKYFTDQEIVFSEIENSDGNLKIHFGGDLIPHQMMDKLSTKYLRNEVGDWFGNADLVIANLETALDVKKSVSASSQLMLGSVYFNADSDYFDIFSGYGKGKYDLLLTANNHMMDMGPKSHLLTLDFLEKMRVESVGSIFQKDKIVPYQLFEKNGIKLGFVNFTYSLNEFLDLDNSCNCLDLNDETVDLQRLKKQVEIVKSQGAEFVIVVLHMGNSYQLYPSAHTVHLFHRVFDEIGVDVIVGGHPHNPQPMEKYEFKDPESGKVKNGFAIYSLGDFVSYDVMSWSRFGVLLELNLVKNKFVVGLESVDFLPFYNCYFEQENQFRLLNLKKVYGDILNGKSRKYLENWHKKEIISAWEFIERIYSSLK